MASPTGAWDEAVNMEALMRLRRGAFSASQTSIKSWGSGGAGGVAGSPLSASPIVPNDGNNATMEPQQPQQRARAPSNLEDAAPTPSERAEEEARRQRFSEDIR